MAQQGGLGFQSPRMRIEDKPSCIWEFSHCATFMRLNSGSGPRKAAGQLGKVVEFWILFFDEVKSWSGILCRN
jgi:hypothetical protein